MRAYAGKGDFKRSAEIPLARSPRNCAARKGVPTDAFIAVGIGLPFSNRAFGNALTCRPSRGGWAQSDFRDRRGFTCWFELYRFVKFVLGHLKSDGRPGEVHGKARRQFTSMLGKEENMEVKDLILLAARAQAAQDQRLLDLAAWMGVSSKAVTVQGSGSLPEEFHAGQCCWAVNAETLVVLHKSSVSAGNRRQFIDECRVDLLVYGCQGSMEQQSALSWLTGGAVCGTDQEEGTDTIFSFPREAGIISRQLAGLSFSRRHDAPVYVFKLGQVASAPEVIMAANNRPVVVRMDRGPCQMFLSAGSPLPDLDEPLSPDHELKEHYDRLIPVLLFLHHCFSESWWHAPESAARLIIDDPLLAERYGFLDYRDLVKSMRHGNYGTSIAFIPWNYWRTSRSAAARLLGENPGLSICIHGCDHTNKEFEAQDPLLLSRRAALALQRMESHRKRTGAAFEQVMVFPQGRFSTAAIPALRANGYLAAVNTTCFPTNSGPNDLKVRDFLRPAVTKYHGFPIFQRRYPRRLFDFAFDLLLGRPVLVVEHHEYLRDGVGTLEQLIAALHQIEPALTWPTLTSLLTRSCLMRNRTNGSTEVQFFTRRFQLICREGSFQLSKHEPDSAAIAAVLVDGKSVPFSVEKDFLKLEVQAEPGQARNVEILDRQLSDGCVTGFGIVHNARVLLRRGLSEFRDNTLARHDGLLKIAKGVARRLKVTGDV